MIDPSTHLFLQRQRLDEDVAHAAQARLAGAVACCRGALVRAATAVRDRLRPAPACATC